MLCRVALSLALGTCVLASPLSYDAAMSAPKKKNQIANTYLCDERFLTRGRTEDTCLDRAGPGLGAFASAPGAPGAPGTPGGPPGSGPPGAGPPGSGPLGANPGNAKAVGNAGEFPTDKDFNFGPGTKGMSDGTKGSSSSSSASASSSDKGGGNGNDKGGDKGGGGGKGK
jgi:hypothetical protein